MGLSTDIELNNMKYISHILEKNFQNWTAEL